jgi:hypothetical protein
VFQTWLIEDDAGVTGRILAAMGKQWIAMLATRFR